MIYIQLIKYSIAFHVESDIVSDASKLRTKGTVQICISYIPSTQDVQLIQSHFQLITEDVSPRCLIESVTVQLHILCGRDITSLCHEMAHLLFLHCSLLRIMLVRGNQLMERVTHSY